MFKANFDNDINSQIENLASSISFECAKVIEHNIFLLYTNYRIEVVLDFQT